MKRIIIEYDEPAANVNVRSEGFEVAEVQVILKAARDNVDASILEALKRKKIAIATPLTHLMPKA